MLLRNAPNGMDAMAKREDQDRGWSQRRWLASPLMEIMDWVVSRPRTDWVGDRHWRLRSHRSLRHAGAAQGMPGRGRPIKRRSRARSRNLRIQLLGQPDASGREYRPGARRRAARHDSAGRRVRRRSDRWHGLAAPAGSAGDATPHFAGGGWLPYLENVYQRQWDERIRDYWADLGAFAVKTHPDR